MSEETKPKRPRYTSRDQIIKRMDRLDRLIASHEKAHRDLTQSRKDLIRKCDPEADIRNQLAMIESDLELIWSRVMRTRGQRKRAGDRLATIQTPVLVACEGEDGSVPR